MLSHWQTILNRKGTWACLYSFNNFYITLIVIRLKNHGTVSKGAFKRTIAAVNLAFL